MLKTQFLAQLRLFCILLLGKFVSLRIHQPFEKMFSKLDKYSFLSSKLEFFLKMFHNLANLGLVEKKSSSFDKIFLHYLKSCMYI